MSAILFYHTKLAADLQAELTIGRAQKRARSLIVKADVDWRMLLVFIRYRDRGLR